MLNKVKVMLKHSRAKKEDCIYVPIRCQNKPYEK